MWPSVHKPKDLLSSDYLQQPVSGNSRQQESVSPALPSVCSMKTSYSGNPDCGCRDSCARKRKSARLYPNSNICLPKKKLLLDGERDFDQKITYDELLISIQARDIDEVKICFDRLLVKELTRDDQCHLLYEIIRKMDLAIFEVALDNDCKFSLKNRGYLSPTEYLTSLTPYPPVSGAVELPPEVISPFIGCLFRSGQLSTQLGWKDSRNSILKNLLHRKWDKNPEIKEMIVSCLKCQKKDFSHNAFDGMTFELATNDNYSANTLEWALRFNAKTEITGRVGTVAPPACPLRLLIRYIYWNIGPLSGSAILHTYSNPNLSIEKAMALIKGGANLLETSAIDDIPPLILLMMESLRQSSFKLYYKVNPDHFYQMKLQALEQIMLKQPDLDEIRVGKKTLQHFLEFSSARYPPSSILLLSLYGLSIPDRISCDMVILIKQMALEAYTSHYLPTEIQPHEIFGESWWPDKRYEKLGLQRLRHIAFLKYLKNVPDDMPLSSCPLPKKVLRTCLLPIIERVAKKDQIHDVGYLPGGAVRGTQ